MTVNKIKNLEELIKLEPGSKFIDQKVTPLTAPGENFGSVIVAVDVTLQTPSETKTIHAVVKLVPPNEFIQQLFHTPITFRNEILFYNKIIPTLQDFQREHNVSEVIDIAPKFYGGRLSLDPNSDKVDDGAALVLENLKMKNYANLDRFKGFNVDEAKLVLKDLAYLHAVPLALKLQKPEIFAEKIRPYLITQLGDEEFEEFSKIKCMEIFESVEECRPYLERIRQAYGVYTHQPSPEPFVTISHNDCWTNNIMIQLKHGKAIASKLVDFQVCVYASPAKDVVFFLFTSIQHNVLIKYYDELVKFYHVTFINVLKELKCDVEPFSFKAFEKELDYAAKTSEFIHVIRMLFPIFAPKGTVKSIEEFSPKDFDKPSAEHIEKLIFVVKEFVKRNWI